jgi:hypothetical protein
MGRRNGVARILQAAWLALAALLLPCCALAEDAAPDYRYRLTVEVETPEGLRTGSSVIEVQQTLVRAGGSPANQAVERRVRGEAAAVNLPGGKTLFALLESENNVDWASYVFVYLAPQRKGESFAEQLDDVLEVKGKQVLPRMWPPVAFLKERSAYPMLVTFNDLADPTSLAQVDPDDLAATFGGGVRLKRITVQLTDEPVTGGIEKLLPPPSPKGFYGMRMRVDGEQRTILIGRWVFSKGTQQ